MPVDAYFRTAGITALMGMTALTGTMAAADQDWPGRALERSRATHLGLPAVPAGRGSAAMVALGRKIFFDRRLSFNGTISCGMCHVPEQAFANNEMATAVGFEGRTVKRNAPTLINVALLGPLFHDGRESALETQFIGPLVAVNEMANPSVGRVVELLRTLPDYRGRFEQAFGHGVSLDAIGASLAEYQRTLVAGSSRFDRWRYGNEVGALTADEQRGLALFTGKAGCVQCHTIGERDALLTDQRFHDTGYGWWREQLRQRPEAGEAIEVAPGVRYRLGREVIASVSAAAIADLGRYEATLDPRDLWKFRTPSLRNVALTAPYMHDGGLRTLAEVVAFYDGGGKPHQGQSPLVRPLGLDAGEREALVAFLATLTSEGLDDLVGEARSAPPDNW
ncbi:MAG: cytochrome c peroxidase [Pseudomonadota bacterium]